MDAATCTITHVGGPTALIEAAGWRLLTDPTFDPPGRRYAFGWGTASRKLAGPAVAIDALEPIDTVLLSHDHHDDNLDDAGRAFLPRAGSIVTTDAGATRLRGGSIGLAPWERHVLDDGKRPPLTITATPARHGPPLSRAFVGHVIGFLLEWPGQRHGAFWISGDTVRFAGTTEVGQRFDVGTALLHLGSVRFPITGPVRFTMDAAEGARVARELDVRTVVPIHYEGWRHFRQGADGIETAFAAAGLGDRLRWLQAGAAVSIDV